MGLVSTGRREEVRNPPWPMAARTLAAQAAWLPVSVRPFSGQHLLHPQLGSKGEGHRWGGKPLPFQIGSLQADCLTQAQGEKPLRQEPVLASCHLFRTDEAKTGERNGKELGQSPRSPENWETTSYPSPFTSVCFVFQSKFTFEISCFLCRDWSHTPAHVDESRTELTLHMLCLSLDTYPWQLFYKLDT